MKNWRKLFNNHPFFFGLILSFSLLGCERILMEPNPSANKTEIFEQMWENIDQKYGLFHLKNIDWNQVGDKYRSQVFDDMDDHEFFDVLAEMLYELRDGHTNLVSDFDLSRNWQWYLDFPENFDFSLVERNYLRENAQISGPLRHQMIDSILYVYYGSFGSRLSPENLNAMLERAKNAKGLIFDVRNNGGGFLNNAFRLASALVREEQIVYVEQRKSGPGHDDFHPEQTASISPSENAYAGPVVVLTNRKSYSASTYFAAMVKYNDHITLMGDSTGGGGGSPYDGELSNGWRYRFSTSRSFDREGYPLELGIAPDIFVNLSPTSQSAGVDDMIEAALLHLKNL
ncbi:MAG: S41 family peptidase [Cryomorphaceae bacterium]|nr:S41 family peptidase [Cryomorphaceae bacterium]